MFRFLTISADPTGNPRRPAAWIAGLFWLGVVLFLTLRPDPSAAVAVAASPWHCLLCGEAGTADFLVNLMLFAPLGAALAGLGWRLGPSAALIAGCSVMIEVIQGVALPGRDAALGDVVANAIGGGVGWLAAMAFNRQLPTLVPAAAVGLFGAQLLATTWLSAPAAELPNASILVAPAVPGRPVYRGTLGGLAVNGRLLHGTEPEAIGVSGSTMAAAFRWSDRDQPGTIPVVRVEDERGWDVAAAGQAEEGVALSVRTRGGSWRLRTPTWLASLPAKPQAGDAVTAAVTLSSGAAVVIGVAGGVTTTREFRHGAQHGWLLLHPWAPPGSADSDWRWWTVCWLAAWGVVLGLVAARRRPLWWGGAAVSVLALATIAGGAPATPLEYLGFVTGLVAGVSSGSLHRPRGAA